MDPITTVDTMTTAMSGGVFGLVGSGTSALANHMQRKQTNLHKEREWQYDIHKMQKQNEAAQSGAPFQIPSIRLPPSIPSSSSKFITFIDGIRSLFRPALTSALMFMTFYFYKTLMEMAQNIEARILSEKVSSFLSSPPSDILSLSEIYGLIHYVVHAVVFSTTTAIVWWFGDRAYRASKAT